MFQDIFRDLPPGGARDWVRKHKAPTTPGELRIYPKQRHNLSDDHLKALKAQLKELWDTGFIAPSHSPVAAPVFSVGKKDGTWRLAIDYVAVSDIATKDEYPIPRIHDLINRLGRAKWCPNSACRRDIARWRSQRKTSGRRPSVPGTGLSNTVSSPFGLGGAPQAFQRLLQSVFSRHSVISWWYTRTACSSIQLRRTSIGSVSGMSLDG